MNTGKLKLSSKDILIEEAVSKAISIPGVRVDRSEFLTQVFSSRVPDIQQILDYGPVETGIPREELADIAHRLIVGRTTATSFAPVMSAVPGKSLMQTDYSVGRDGFFAEALRIAQELSYIYGAKDMWIDGQFDNEKVKNQLMIYCGVMLGVSGAASALRVLSPFIAKTAMKTTPLKIVKRIFGKSFIKKTLGAGIAKSAVPVVSGAVSGGINYAAMLPMAKKLMAALDKAAFDYSEEEFASDIAVIESMSDDEISDATDTAESTEKKNHLHNAVKKIPLPAVKIGRKRKPDSPDQFEQLKKYKELFDLGVISEDEFEQKKKELLSL